MSRSTFPLWVFAAVAALIAVTAFVVAQIADGAGAIVVLAATSAWLVVVQYRGRNMGRANG